MIDNPKKRPWGLPRPAPELGAWKWMTSEEIREVYGNRCIGDFNEHGFNYRCNCSECEYGKDQYRWG